MCGCYRERLHVNHLWEWNVGKEGVASFNPLTPSFQYSYIIQQTGKEKTQANQVEDVILI